MRSFVVVDLIDVAKREADVVEAVEQAMAAEGLDFKLETQPEVVGERAILEVRCQGIIGAGGGAAEQIVDLLLAQHNRQHAVLETVVIEYVSKARGDEHAEAPILKRPRRMFP